MDVGWRCVEVELGSMVTLGYHSVCSTAVVLLCPHCLGRKGCGYTCP